MAGTAETFGMRIVGPLLSSDQVRVRTLGT